MITLLKRYWSFIVVAIVLGAIALGFVVFSPKGEIIETLAYGELFHVERDGEIVIETNFPSPCGLGFTSVGTEQDNTRILFMAQENGTVDAVVFANGVVDTTYDISNYRCPEAPTE